MTQRSLADWLSYLEQLHPTAIDMGLERSREVARRLGLGRPAKRVVTVTGTNGKGSTCALLAELLREQGLSVGVYSSPHLLRYNERVRIDGIEAGDAQLCDAFSAVEAARGEISLTYFEMGTLAAFWLFERAGLDFAVLEVGLGGRLDAVNLIDADLALITSMAWTMPSGWAIPAKAWLSRKPVSCAPVNRPCAAISIPRSHCWSRWLRWGHRFTCVVATTTWRSPIMAGTGAGWPRTARRWRCTICRCSSCPWKTPRWPCRPTRCSSCPGRRSAWPRRCGGPG